MQDSPLAGFLYHAGKELWPQIREGDVLRMVREPDNPRNAKGVRVEWRDRKIGYYPAGESRRGAPHGQRPRAGGAHDAAG